MFWFDKKFQLIYPKKFDLVSAVSLITNKYFGCVISINTKFDWTVQVLIQDLFFKEYKIKLAKNVEDKCAKLNLHLIFKTLIFILQTKTNIKSKVNLSDVGIG